MHVLGTLILVPRNSCTSVPFSATPFPHFPCPKFLAVTYGEAVVALVIELRKGSCHSPFAHWFDSEFAHRLQIDEWHVGLVKIGIGSLSRKTGSEKWPCHFFTLSPPAIPKNSLKVN